METNSTDSGALFRLNHRVYDGALADFGTIDAVLASPLRGDTELLVTMVSAVRVGRFDDTAELQQAMTAKFNEDE